MTGINASKIIQNLEFVNSFDLSSLAFFLFWFFPFCNLGPVHTPMPRPWERGRWPKASLRIAEEDRMPQAITTAEKAIAEVRGLVVNNANGADNLDFKQARSMQDIGRKLLQSMGVAEPDDASIQLAIEANDAFVAELERIRNAAQGPAIDQDQE
jgi:hypothetical protein